MTVLHTFDYGTDGTIFISTDNLVGLAHFFLLGCLSCHWTKTYCTSRVIRGKTGHPTYEINITSIIAFRECGAEYDGIKLFVNVEWSMMVLNFS